MRTSSNPAFRNLPSGQGGYATFDRGSGMAGGTAAYADRAQVGIGRADAGQRPITVDDIVTKTAITAGAAIVAGASHGVERPVRAGPAGVHRRLRRVARSSSSSRAATPRS